ncbi:hypothetical protein [Erwinia pyrifoliae]|uniref:hypothetical protein n=1 Tax=Erwinia pyrifoliae TaxID=79967 RepID=UPI00223BC61E|nr:hypothetical protein [Erwinia pyrifoliae]MCT2388643.1 hypothetical protein [Erwinia pyrifoliae]MCU8586812.1 hypothetical protein [Erwinia pyrifoliae]
MFNPNTLQPLHGKYISGWMSQSSPTVRHDSVLNRISGVQNGPDFLLAANEYMKNVQDGTLLINNLAEVKPAQAAASSSSHSSQPEIFPNKRYSTKFVNKVKQELFTDPVREVAKRYRLPYHTVYNWANGPGGNREKIKRNNISDMANRSRFHSLSKPDLTAASQQKIRSNRRFSPEFVNRVKQNLLTQSIQQVAKKYGLLYQTVYAWANKPGGSREKIKRNNIIEIARRSRFHSLSGLRKYCIDRVNDLCSQPQNLREISRAEIIRQVAKEEGIEIRTVINWVSRDRNYSYSRRVFQLPKSTPDEKHSVKNVQTHQSVNRNSYAHQLNAQNNIGSVELWANESSTAPPTVRTDSTNDEKNAKSFAECLQELKEWQDKHLCRM